MIKIAIRIINKNHGYRAKVISFDNASYKVRTKNYPKEENEYMSWLMLRKRIIRDFGYHLRRDKNKYRWEVKFKAVSDLINDINDIDNGNLKYLSITDYLKEDDKSNVNNDIRPPKKQEETQTDN